MHPTPNHFATGDDDDVDVVIYPDFPLLLLLLLSPSAVAHPSRMVIHSGAELRFYVK